MSPVLLLLCPLFPLLLLLWYMARVCPPHLAEDLLESLGLGGNGLLLHLPALVGPATLPLPHLGTTLHYTTLHYTTLHYTTLHYTTLHYTTLHYTTLHYTTLHFTTLHYTTLHYTTLPFTILHYTTLHCTKLHYNTLLYTTLHFTTLHCLINVAILRGNHFLISKHQ